MDPGYSMSDAHIYAGCTKYPYKGKTPTTAPGQYTYNVSGLDRSSGLTATFTNIDGCIWVIAHAVICNVDGIGLSGSGTYSRKIGTCNCPNTMSTSQMVSEVNTDTYKLTVFPNPFSTFTTFDLKMNSDSDVRIEIFSTTGSTIEVLLNENLKQGDNRAVDFDASRYPHTYYIYRISTGLQKKSGMIMKLK
jgi:hypothetical protein